MLAEREEEQRNLLEVVGQPLGRALDLQDLDRLGFVGDDVRGVELGLLDGFPQLSHGVLVHGGEERPLGGVAEQEEAPVLLVASGGARMATSRMRDWTSRGMPFRGRECLKSQL